MANRDSITPADVRAALYYDSATGIFTWRERPSDSPANRRFNTRFTGTIAGTIAKKKAKSYLQIRLHGRIYYAHRLAWAYMTGEWPPPGFEVDHEDRDGLHNWWTNLRLATSTQNNANFPKPSHNTSGFKGVSFLRDRMKYRAAIQISGKTHILGYFDDPEDAHAAYRKAASTAFGTFSRPA